MPATMPREPVHVSGMTPPTGASSPSTRTSSGMSSTIMQTPQMAAANASWLAARTHEYVTPAQATRPTRLKVA